jgi:hypothetical protein
MPIETYLIGPEEKEVQIDIPEAYADGGDKEAGYVNNVFIPYYTSGLWAADQAKTVAEAPDHPFSSLPDWAARGFYRLGEMANVAQVRLGFDNPENAAKDIQDYQNYLAQVPYSEEVEEAITALGTAESVGEFWDAATTTAGLKANGTVVGESFATFAPALGATAIAASGGAGPVALASVAGLGSLATEVGASTLEAMNEYLVEQTGKQSPLKDDKLVADLLKDEDRMAEFEAFAVKRGIPIAAVDALSVGFAGKLVGAVQRSKKAAEEAGKTYSKLKVPAAVGTEALVIQPTLGGTGEFAAQIASGQDVKLGEILLEGVAEIPGGTFEIGLGLMSRNKGQEDTEARETTVENPVSEEVRGMGSATAQLKFVDSISADDELNTVLRDLSAGGDKAKPYLDRILNWVNPSEIKKDNWIVKKNFDNIFGFENKKSKEALTEYLVKEGYVEPKKGSKNLLDWTAKAEEEFNIEYQASLNKEKDRKTYYDLGQLKGELTRQLKTADGRSAPRLRREIQAVEEEQQRYRYAATDKPSPEWHMQATRQRQIAPEDIKYTDIKQAGFVPSYITTEGQARTFAEQNNISEDQIPNLIGKLTYRLGEGLYQDYLAQRLDAREKQILERERPFILPNRIKTSLDGVLKRVGLQNDRTGKPFASAQDIANEYTELKETQKLIEEQQAVNDATNTQQTEQQKNASKNIQDRLKRMENIFKSGIWKRTSRENDVVIPTPYFEMDSQSPERQQRIDNINTKFALNDPNVSILPEKIKAPGDVILDVDLQAFVDKEKIKLLEDPDSEEQLVDEIKTMQSVSEVLDPAQPVSQDLNQNNIEDTYLNDIKDPANKLFFSPELVTEEEIAAAAPQLKEYYEGLDLAKSGKTLWSNAWSLTLPTRIAEKVPAFRKFYDYILGRRASREQKNIFGFQGLRDFFTKTTGEEQKTLSKFAVILDALGTSKQVKLTVDKETGDAILTIAPEPVATIDPETNEVSTDIDADQYRTILANLNVQPGTIRLPKKLFDKYNEARQGFDRMYETVGRSFIRFFLQKAPLYGNIKEAQGDTMTVLNDKIRQSVRMYLNDLAKLVPLSTLNFEIIPRGNKNPITVNIMDLESYTKDLNSNQLATQILTKFKDDNKDTFKKGSRENLLIDNVISQLNIIKFINDYETTKTRNPYYIPRQRQGDFFFTVRDNKLKKIIHYETSTPRILDSDFTPRFIRDQRKRLNERLKQLKESGIYADSKRYTISEIDNRVEAKDDILKKLDVKDIGILQRLADAFGYNKNSDEVKKFIGQLETVITTDGFNKFLETREAKNVVNGYYTPATADNYLAYSLSNYIRTGSDTASNLEYYRPMRTALNNLAEKVGKNNKLVTTAEKLVENINDPADAGSVLKGLTFHYTIGMNFSSAIVNLTQLFVATLPVLKVVVGKGSTRELLKAMNDARLLFKLSKDRLDTYGFNFESPTVPQQVKGKINQDEWNMLRDLHSRGIIQAVTSIDSGANLTRTLGELNNSLPPNAAQAGAKILEASSFMFGAIEQINRITTALTAYRLAKKSPSNLKKLDDYSKYTVYSTRKTTPTQAAEMMVMKTQFLISKENRPELFHKGFLNVATQFMPYVINYVGLYAQALSIAKVDKKLGSALLGSMVLSMLFFAGAMGLPWMENMKQLLQMLSKEVSDYEFDLETGMRQTLANFGITGVANDILMSGVFGQLTGIDLRRRVGVGEVIPFDLMAGDLSVAYGPTGSVVIDSARKAREALKQKEFNAVEFATAFLPIGVRNAYDAAATQFLDKPVRTTQGRVLMPSKEIGTLENLAKAFGFTPKSVAEARQQRQYYKFLQGETKGIQDYYYSQLAKHINLANLEYTKGDMSNYKKQTDIVRDIYKEIADLNREAATEKRPDLIINIQSEALRNRIATELLGQTDRGVAMRSIRKNARPMAEEATLRRLGLLTRD